MVFGGGAEDLGYFGGSEFVVLFEPVRHVAGGFPEGVVEAAVEAHGDEVGVSFDAGIADAFVRNDVDCEFNVH